MTTQCLFRGTALLTARTLTTDTGTDKGLPKPNPIPSPKTKQDVTDWKTKQTVHASLIEHMCLNFPFNFAVLCLFFLWFCAWHLILILSVYQVIVFVMTDEINLHFPEHVPLLYEAKCWLNRGIFAEQTLNFINLQVCIQRAKNW